MAGTIVAGIMARMRETVDEFAARLRQLRKERGVPADQLSLDCKVSRSYIGRWEREQCTVNRKVLQRVVDRLGLPPADRMELFRLADLRDAPQTVALHNPFRDRADANLLSELLTVDGIDAVTVGHDPGGPPAAALLDSVGWVLAYYAARQGVLPPFTHVAWPEQLIKAGAMPRIGNDVFPKGVPDEYHIQYVAADPLPDLLSVGNDDLAAFIENFNALDAHITAVAHAYRDLVFADRDRTCTIVQQIQHCSIVRQGDSLAHSLRLRFRTADANDQHGVHDVAPDVVAQVGERTLGFYLWCGWRGGSTGNAPPWVCQLATTDEVALDTVGRAHPANLRTYRDRASLRDALYAMHAPFWPWLLFLLRMNYEVPEGSASDIEREMRAIPLSDATRLRILTDRWILTAADPKVVIRYLESLNSLPLDEPVASKATKRIKKSRVPKRRKK